MMPCSVISFCFRSVPAVFVICLLVALSPAISATSGAPKRRPRSDSVEQLQSRTCWTVCRCSTVDNSTTVDCSRSNLDSLPPSSAASGGDANVLPADVQTLVGDGNRLSRLDVNFSSLIPNVGTVSFNLNNISEIGPEVFRGLRSLRRLSLNDNRIRQLPENAFVDTVNLVDLSLAGNPLDVVSVGAALFQADGARLRRLDVSRTDVGQFGPLPETLFGRLYNLERLVLRDVTIENMTAGYFSSLHSGLVTLDLTNSNINNVDVKSFTSLSSTLTELLLDNVIITTTDLENIFAGLVETSNPSLQTTPSTTDEDVNSTTTTAASDVDARLETISLKNVFVGDNADTRMNSHLFRHLGQSKLETLRFDGNFFDHHMGGKIPERLFHPLRHLASLSLNYCDIRSIPSETFRGLHRLQTLTLRGNQLSCVRQSHCGFMTASQATLSRLATLDLSDNVLESGISDDSDDDYMSGRGGGVRFPDDVFPELAELDLSGNHLSSIPIGMFGKLRHLTRLRLSDNVRLTDVEPEALAGLSGLLRLEIDGCRRLTHLKAGAFSGLNNVKVLSIRDSGLVHVHHSIISRLEHLEELHLRNNKLGEQDDAIDRLTIRSQNSLKLVDLGGNKLRSMPTGMLVHSTRLKALYLDDNRLTACSGLRALDSTSTSRELVVDLSDNLITEPSEDCLAGRTTSIYLAGNPIYCGSCVTAQFIASMSADRHRTTLPDRDRIACASPSDVAGHDAFGSSSAMSGQWHCRWRDVVIAVALATLSLAVVLIAIAVSRRRIMASECCIVACRRRCHGRTISLATGSTSSVTISNGCYGNGSTSETGVSQPLSSGIMSIGGGDSGTTRYSPLVEDDGRHEFQTLASNGHHFWHSAGVPPSKMTSATSVAEPNAAGYGHDGMTSSTADIKCPLMNDVSHLDTCPKSSSGLNGVGNQRARQTIASGSADGRNAKRKEDMESTRGDVEDSV